MITGLVTLCSNRPNLVHTRLSGASNAGAASAATRKAAAIAIDHQRTALPCTTGHSAIIANTAAKTYPKPRSDEPLTGPVRVKLSCIVMRHNLHPVRTRAACFCRDHAFVTRMRQHGELSYGCGNNRADWTSPPTAALGGAAERVATARGGR